MNAPERYRRFRDAHGEVARNFAMGTEEEQSSYYTGLQELGAKAGNELQQVYGNYLQELRAAWAGDDSIQRVAIAYRNLEREYGRIQTDYFKEFEIRRQRTLDTLNALTSTSSVQALDSWIEYLGEVRQHLVPNGESKPSGKNRPLDHA
jgi:hypothetical protein